ncbi:hypothetical protein ABMA27_016512 [Loxostege sticticalis]|uniref:Uncharacterized protein n=1 Tax=Loxostege sticticalis TaxID=481309 RepID=A0ABR3I2J2_LOXSC
MEDQPTWWRKWWRRMTGRRRRISNDEEPLLGESGSPSVGEEALEWCAALSRAARLRLLRLTGQAYREVEDRPPERRQLTKREVEELQEVWREAIKNTESKLNLYRHGELYTV